MQLLKRCFLDLGGNHLGATRESISRELIAQPLVNFTNYTCSFFYCSFLLSVLKEASSIMLAASRDPAYAVAEITTSWCTKTDKCLHRSNLRPLNSLPEPMNERYERRKRSTMTSLPLLMSKGSYQQLGMICDFTAFSTTFSKRPI